MLGFLPGQFPSSLIYGRMINPRKKVVLAKIYPDHPFTLEKVLEIIYIEFIEKFRCGELQNTVVHILNIRKI